MIELENVFIKKGVHNIVSNLNWTIHSGERWLLFGLNGSGKTTLLSMLATYQSPSKGKMYIDKRLYDAGNKYAFRAKIGFASTSFFDHYFSKETALDIVLSGFGGGFGLNDAIGPVEVSQAKLLLSYLDLKKKYQYPYDTLSSGQRQKVIIARAIINDPEVIILDEPYSGLDIIGQLKVQKLMEKLLVEIPRTLILVTHHCEEIAPFMTHAALLKNGTIHSDGCIKEILSEQNLSAFLEQSVAVNWYEGRVDITLK